jgi:hypothetical protein
MKLVNRDHCGRRIVDCRRQRLERDVDDTRYAKVGSCSIDRSSPKATAERKSSASSEAAPPYNLKSGSSVAIKSPT